MTTATTLEEETNTIAEFGQVPADLLDLANKSHELRMYRLSTDRTKALGEALGFAAAFDSPDVFTAYADIVVDESYFNFEMKFNTRPQTIALRYKSDRWSAVESRGAHSTSARAIATETPVKNRGVKTVYHAFLEATALERIATLLRMEQEPLSKLLIRINFKDKTLALVAAEDAASNLPDLEAFKTVHIPRTQVKQETEVMNEQDNAPESVEDLSDSQPDATPQEKLEAAEKTDAPQPTSSEESDLSSQSQSEGGVDAPLPDAPAQNASVEQNAAHEAAPAQRLQETPRASYASPAPAARSTEVTPKYHTYSQSEVDALIKRSAENVQNAVTTKINAQTKTVEKNLKNQEFAFNQAIDKLTKHMEEANAKLDKATAELNNASGKQMESFKVSLNKELDDFKTNFNKQVMPGIKLLDARLEQLADMKKQTQNASGVNPSVLMGVLAAVAIVSVVNLFIGWYAFDRISNLEKSHTEMMMKSGSGATSDVPIPDLMKDQIDKQNASN